MGNFGSGTVPRPNVYIVNEYDDEQFPHTIDTVGSVGRARTTLYARTFAAELFPRSPYTGKFGGTC